ncbi:MAG: S8 family serine peptidase, partial [Sedimentisphaerales bacterium]|nr:S8 family serine peptidase [Sedimentisphaerales bacterium]
MYSAFHNRCGWFLCAFLSLICLAHGSGILTLSPDEDFPVSGPHGGPFSPLTKTYELSNTGDAVIYWGTEADAAWITMEPDWGKLSPGQSTTVTVTVTTDANILPSGIHTQTLSFLDLSNNTQLTRQLILTVQAGPIFHVLPDEDFIISGTQGGPFSPLTKTYELSNSGTEDIFWGTETDADWITLIPDWGKLLPGEFATVTVSASCATINTLPAGSYTQHISFLDFTNDTQLNRQLCLTVSTLQGISVSPKELSFSITEGASSCQALTLSNTGPSAYSFSLRSRAVKNNNKASAPCLEPAQSPAYPAMGVTADSHPGRILVRFNHSIAAAANSSALKQSLLTSTCGGTIVREFSSVPGLSLVKLPDGVSVQNAIDQLRHTENVLYAQPDYRLYADNTYPNDPRFNEQWGLNNLAGVGTVDADIDAPEAWDIHTGDSTIIVAVIDSGVDYTHADLAGNMWVNQAESNGQAGQDDDGNGYIDDIYGYDFCNEDPNPKDDHYHGTHCAGIIGAVGNNGIGITGTCWNVRIMALKFLDAGGQGWASDAIQCIQYASKMKANVLSNSWGGGPYDQALKDAIEAAQANNILFVASAGNESMNTDDNLHYPSCYTSENIIAVLATTDNDGKASFSNYGKLTVDLGAPGSDILSCVPGNSYQNASGTSMATPFVSGACAMLWSANPGLTWQEVKTILMESADPTLSNYCVSGGRLNLEKAMQEACVQWLAFDIVQGQIDPGQSLPIQVSLDASELAAGSYDAEIILLSNDPEHGQIIIPVHVDVQKEPLEIIPDTAFESLGIEGGPFQPESTNYSIRNISKESILWSISQKPEWLAISSTEGTLDPAQSVEISISLNSSALVLSPNQYKEFIEFENITHNTKQIRETILTVKCPDKFTEQFDATNNDLSYMTLTLMPSDTKSGYRMCVEPNSLISVFDEMSNITYVSVGDDDFVEVPFADNNQFTFFGLPYKSVFIGSNGYLTFGTGDVEYQASLLNHFRLPRISALFADLTPAHSQCISYCQAPESFTVTYDKIPLYGDKTKTVSCQIVLHFNDGYIQVKYLDVHEASAICGLSDGTGLVTSFEASDLSDNIICCDCGDLTGDSSVDMADLGHLISVWLAADCSMPFWCQYADITKDSTVNLADLSSLALNWGQTIYAWTESIFCQDLNQKGWSSPVYMPELDSDGNKAFCTRFSRDKLHMFWSRYNPSLGFKCIWQADRNSLNEPFSAPRALVELSQTGKNFGGAWISDDNRRLYYFELIAGGGADIKMATWSDALHQWIPTKIFTELGGSEYGNFIPSLTSDELMLFWQSLRPGGAGNHDIWTASRTSLDAPFENIRNLSEINLSNNDSAPFILPDGRTLYFSSSTRAGYESWCNIYKATRNHLSETFGNISLINYPGYEINSSEYPSYVTPDENTLYFNNDNYGVYHISLQGLATGYAASSPCQSSNEHTLYYERYIPEISKTCVVQSEIAENSISFGREIVLEDLTSADINAKDPWISQDNLRLYFTEQTIAGPSMIKMAHRQDIHSPWSVETSFPELNSNGTASAPSLSADELMLVYTSTINETQISPIAYWSFNESSGAIAADTSGNDRHGTLMNMDDTDWISGAKSNALNFDGIDEYIAVSGFTEVSGSAPRTCSAWIKKADIDEAVILSWGEPVVGQKWMFRVGAAGNLEVSLWGGIIQGTTIINNGIWHHVASVYSNTDVSGDGTIDLRDVQLYVDGQLEQNTAVMNYDPTLGVPGVETAATQNVLIGARIGGVDWDSYYQGALDDVRIYDYPLDAKDISLLAGKVNSSCLCIAERTNTNEPFADIRPLTELNAAGLNESPILSPDGHTLYFTSNRQENQKWSIYKATRTSIAELFTLEALLSVGNDLD